MAVGQIRFEDGAAYERMMGVWSRLAGEIFLSWLAPSAGLRWIDVGCGSGCGSAIATRFGIARVYDVSGFADHGLMPVLEQLGAGTMQGHYPPRGSLAAADAAI
jgi:hypothetical protein